MKPTEQTYKKPEEEKTKKINDDDRYYIKYSQVAFCFFVDQFNHFKAPVY